MNETGKAISASFAFVSQVGGECEALASLIKQELSALFRSGPLGSLYTADEWASSYRTDASGWAFTAAAWSLPLTPKGKRKVTTHLAFQMSFLCDDLEGGLSPQPLLHINLWDEPTNVRSESYMGFKMSGFTPQCLDRLHAGTARLFRWPAHNGAADSWTYSLPLAGINSLEDIRAQICALVNALLIDADEGEAALEDVPNVVRWSAIEDMQRYYRVVC